MNRICSCGKNVDVGFMLMFLRLWFGNRPISDIGVEEVRHVLDLLYHNKVVHII